MWSVGISVSPCRDAKRVGYDSSQIDRIVIRMAQYFLARNMRVIFGHDWREDGVMRAVADYASKVASGKGIRQSRNLVPRDGGRGNAECSMSSEGRRFMAARRLCGADREEYSR